MWTKLKLTLWKILLIRRRHWILTTVEILIPIILFTLIAYGRSKISGMNKIEKNATYTELSRLEEIDANLPIGGFNLWYAPYTGFTESIMTKVQERFQIPGEAIKEFTSEENLREHFTKNSSSTIAAVIFKTDDFKKLNYDIGFHDKYLIWHTDKRFMPLLEAEEEKSGYSNYLCKGFAALQIAINTAFMEMFIEKDQLNFDFSIQEFPYPPHSLDSGINQLFMHFLPLVTIFSFVFLCPAVLKRVGEEKQSGAKEYLKMVGMNSSMIWFGWFIHALTSNMISIIAIVILMKIPFWGVPYPPIEFSNGVILFLFLFLYCMAAVTFCFLVATIIHTPSIATITGILIWTFSYFIPQVIITANENLHWGYKMSFSIFPNMALYYGYSAIAMYEMREVGIQWYNIFQSGSGGANDITMGNVFLCFLVQMVVFMLLTLYIENVRPGEYGIKKPLFFPLLDFKDWMKNCCASRKVEIPLLSEDSREKYCIQIRKLRKQFYKNVAVDNLDMDIHKNSITVLLGHNGAGKTTTMSLLTGMLSPTRGTILVNGKDIGKHTSKVRKNMGLCTQHNLLLPDLTAIEHLQFFGMIKGKRSKECTEDAEVLLEKFKIKKNAMPHELSGGMKRKLCLAMALISDADVLILDEPTSGLDPESRREVWNMLLEIRRTRTIIISTHFMEEADVLGDHIAIMANGRLQCHDTPLNLKKRFNTGYHLSLMLRSNASREDIDSAMHEEIPGVQLLRENGDNAVYLLPLDAKPLYSNLFDKLEKNKDKWGIDNIGLSITTLEDVFLRARDDADGHKFQVGDSGNEEETIKQLQKSKSRIRRQYNIWLSLWMKRRYFFMKKFYWYIPTIIVTIIIFLTTMWLETANTYYTYGGPKLNLTLDAYGKTGVVYGGNAEPSPLLASAARMKEYYQTALLKEEGVPINVEDVTQEIIHKGIENIAYYKKHMVVAAEFNTSTSDDKITVNAMYSKSALHSLPISINLAMNAILKTYLNDSFSISVANAPLNPLYTDYSPSEMSEINVGILWLILIPTGLLFLMSDFIIFPNLELSTKFIKIQNMAGVKTHVYWFVNIMYDYILYLFKLILLFLSIKSMDALAFDSTLFGTPEISTLIIIFLVYGAVSLPFVYLFCYRKTISGGYTRLIMVGLFTGIVPTVVIRAMELSEDDYYINIGKYLKDVLLCMCPQFGLHYVSVKFAQKYVQNFNWVYMNVCKRKHICEVQPNPCCKGFDTLECSDYRNYFNNEELGIKDDLLKMFPSFVIYFAILSFISTLKFEKILHCIRYLCCCLSGSTTDDNEDYGYKTKLFVKNLTKSFGKKQVVNRLKLKLKRNKCFGLLGVNGAGKSTTFRMLTKETFFDDGKITLPDYFAKEKSNKTVTIDDDKYSEQIGYCPQEDYLNFFLTGHELLSSIAIMKGYTLKDSETISKFLLQQFGLMEYANKPCLEYSGGNKRKLSTCIAFLGSPNVIMLDEPTSGVDPTSRRKFWKILSDYKKNTDTSFLLCSHSMEECEALCDKIGIMKNGSITKRGTLSKLKNEYEKGYIIDLKLKQAKEDWVLINDDEELRRKIEMLTQATCTSKGAYSDSLKYHIDETATLSKLFNVMEDLKRKHEGFIDDYIISQVSLEDIFLSVAREIEENSKQGASTLNIFGCLYSKDTKDDSNIV